MCLNAYTKIYIKKIKNNTKIHIKKKKTINLNQSYRKEQKSTKRESTHNFFVEKNMNWMREMILKFFLYKIKNLLKPNVKVQIYYVLFVSTMMFSKKWVIFWEVFSIKLSHFLMFDSNFKWVEKQFPNFSYLVWCEIKLFSKNI